MTKKEAIEATKAGFFVYHPISEGYIKIKMSLKADSLGVTYPVYKLQFFGDCSPQDGWDAEWLGER